MPEPGPDHADYGLVMPFVVCTSKGGAYDDQAFVAGWEAGAIDYALHMLAPMGGTLERTVPPTLLPQLDLVAMRHGFTMRSEPWHEHPDDWAHVTFTQRKALEVDPEADTEP